MWPTGARNSMVHSPAPASMSPHFPPEPARSAPKNRNRKPKTSMSEKNIHSVGIIMNGVTGRMGLNQHLRRSIYAIMQQGGVRLGPSETIMPQPILVGRNAAKLASVLASPDYAVYFDSQTTDRRATDVKKAIAAGKHIYCEKPVSDSLDTALELLSLAEKAGVKHGVVQDKLWLPGMLKLKTLMAVS